MKKQYEAPAVQNIGALAELTRNGFSKGNDIGKGKSGDPGTSPASPMS